MGKELRESRLLACSVRGRVFTQLLTHKFTHLSSSETGKGKVRMQQERGGEAANGNSRGRARGGISKSWAP